MYFVGFFAISEYTAGSFSCDDIFKGFWLSYNTMGVIIRYYPLIKIFCVMLHFSQYFLNCLMEQWNLWKFHILSTQKLLLWLASMYPKKKLSLPELDSWLSIDAAIIRHSLWFKALDHNPCEQISRAWQCPGSSVSWLDPASTHCCKCHCDVTCALQFSFQSRVWAVSPHVFIGLLVHNVISGESYVPIEFVYTAMKLLQIGVKIG